MKRNTLDEARIADEKARETVSGDKEEAFSVMAGRLGLMRLYRNRKSIGHAWVGDYGGGWYCLTTNSRDSEKCMLALSNGKPLPSGYSAVRQRPYHYLDGPSFFCISNIWKMFCVAFIAGACMIFSAYNGNS